MPLFGHTETGYALDVWPHADQASYASWAALIPGHEGWTVAQLPAGTLAGATPDGAGGWTNPPVPAPPAPQPREVRKWEFAMFATAAVGGAGTFGAIIKACRDSVDNAVVGAYELFKSQPSLLKTEADTFLTLLQAKAIITAQQRTDILAAWLTK